MKPRRVVVTVEMTTDISASELRGEIREALEPMCKWGDKVHQVQVNVIKEERPRRNQSRGSRGSR